MRRRKRLIRFPFSEIKSGSVSRTAQQTLVSYSVGALPLLDRIMDRVRLKEFLQEYMVEDKRCKIAPTTGILLLVKNYLVSREPVYGVGEWAQQYAPEFLCLSKRQIKFLNDDRIGRCLDKLFDADCRSIVLALVVHVVREFNVSLDELHNDSTTITLYGRYEGASKESTKRGKPTLAITWGHNKDHRFDLKQLLYILTVSADGAVPVNFRTGNGNLTDDKTHRETWDLLCKISGRCDFLYIGDSKLATKENMSYIKQRGGRFISVLPQTRKEDENFRTLIVQQRVSWKEIYRKLDEEDKNRVIDVISLSDQPCVTAEGYRLLWFHSSRKEELDSLSRNNKIERSLLSLSELREKLRSPRTRYKQKANVHAVVEKRLAKFGASCWIKVEVIEFEEEELGQEKPGRPGKDTRYVVKKVRNRFDLHYEIDPLKTTESAMQDGVFPVVTNDKELSPEEVLLAYKKQALVEKRFSQLKTDFEVAPVYLKSASRIEALLCVYFFVLLIQALLERELRKAMKQEGIESLPLYPEERLCRAPTTRRVIDVFDNIRRHELFGPTGEKIQFMTEMSSIQKEILRLLGLSPKTFQR